MNVFTSVKCKRAGHESEVIKADISKAYKGAKRPHYIVRCIGGGCCFSDYFINKSDAIFNWNKEHTK